MSCAIRKGCTPKEKEGFCEMPKDVSGLAATSLSDLEGRWTVVRGLNRAYDCWNCQRMTFEQQSDRLSDYTYDFEPVPPQNSSIACQTNVVSDEAGVIPGRYAVSYDAFGIGGEDQWFIVSQRDERALIYYCGETPYDRYTGAVIMARNPDQPLTADELSQFQDDLDGLGLESNLSIKQFCSPDNGQCSN